ncbi:MAG TPA: glycosyltransferase family 39 protein [Fimbriimonadaceae bacterium]|nr:glycosyltransferase family 39 protein [Fimbriimonadaceae bacterium]
MLGSFLTILFGLGVTSLVWSTVRDWFGDLDPAESIGLCGLIALGLVGLETLLIGLIPGGLNWGVYLEGAGAVIGLALGIKEAPKALKAAKPGGWRAAILGVFILALLFAWIGALGPSDANDWDSLAYHLAVPKMWLEAGQIVEVPFIHHSNFPFAIDNLFIWGLKWGGAAGAKTFSVLIYALGMLTLFGLGRRLYGEKAGWWAALTFAAIPCALWESGTAYIDVGHGLFAGLGILYVAEFLQNREAKGALFRAAVCLALGCATKYTGLQTLFASLLVLAVGSALAKDLQKGLRGVGIALAAFLVLAGPWYVKNFLWTGNPVYPFFYEVIGSQNWDDFSAKIYKEEQQTFGVGRDPTSLGHAILGLSYQPGRYVNPGQTAGLGMPTGALGAAMVAAWLVWLASGRLRRFEASVLITTGISLMMWFVLSQQSRYLITLGIPAAILAGAAISRLKIGPLLAGLVAIQAAAALYVGKVFHVDPKLPVILGRTSIEDYWKATAPFAEAAKGIDEAVTKQGKVALFDEVFGYFLNVPYFWANPGHSTQIPWANLDDGVAWADEMKRQGFTHVYMNLSIGVAFPDRETRDRWLRAAGLSDAREPFPPEERAAAFQDLRNKWRHLVAEAIAEGRLAPIQSYKTGMLFELR